MATLPDPDAAARLALVGTAEPQAQARQLAAGALSCQLVDGALRDLRWCGVALVRAVSYLLRDPDWGTVPAEIGPVTGTTLPDRFDLRFDLRWRTAQGVLHAAARVCGQADGRLDFEVTATPDAAMPTNRCGFVVLHPADCAGRPLQVAHTDGTEAHTAFPDTISPGQPVFNIRGLHHGLAHGVQLNLQLRAELPHDPAGKFEMEDQRNWSDASFKTYVASLLDPWPYTLPAGRPLRQSVSLRASGGATQGAAARAPATHAPQRRAPTMLTLGPASALRLPAIGIGVPPGLAHARPEEVAALQALGAQWWQVEAGLGEADLAAQLQAVAALRQGGGCQVQLDLVVPDALAPGAAAQAAAAACAAAGLKVQALRLLPAAYLKSYQPNGPWPDLPPLADYAAAARAQCPGVLVGGGMFTGFTELNRLRPDAAGLDFIGHLTWPTVHDADDQAVMQTLEALPHIARSVHALWPGLPYRLGPSTLGMRRNPYGDLPVPNPEGRRIALADTDPRLHAAFGAAWTVGYAAAVAPWPLSVLALHESHGPRGPLSGTAPGAGLAPAWPVLGALALAAGAACVPVQGLSPGLAALAWQGADQRVRGLLANLSDQPFTVQLPPAWGGQHLTLTPYDVRHCG